MFTVKILNKMPRSFLVKFGYSRIGSKLVNIVKEKQAQKWHDVGNGIKMYLDITNPYTWDLTEGKEHEDNVKETFLKNINEGDNVIDVGANIGEFSLIAAKKVGKNGHVICIEPLEQAIRWLKKNFKLNEFANYEILQKAVGEKMEKKTMYKKSSSSEHAILDSKITEKELIPTGAITVDTIDNIVSSKKIKKVDMLKIDVEGFEYEVFCGCKESFNEKKIKKIICEIHSTYLKKKGIDDEMIYSLLNENGFSIKFIESDENRPHIFATLL